MKYSENRLLTRGSVNNLILPKDRKPQRLMLLVNKRLPGISLYDADTHTLLCQAKTTRICPHEAAFSQDGKYIFVPIYGSSGVGKPGTDEHTIQVFRTADCSEAGNLDTGDYKRPHGIATGASGRVYVTAETAESLIILDGQPQPAIAGAIPTGSKTSHMFAITRDETRAYVSNVQSKTISVLDVANRTLLRVIPTECDNQRMTLGPDERYFVTSLGPAKKIAFFRTSDDELDFTVSVPGTPFVSKFSCDGKFLYNAGFASNGELGAWKIDVAASKVTTEITTGLGFDPGSLEVNPFTRDVYVSDQPTNKVHIIDANTWTLKKSFSTSETPDAMAFLLSF